MAKTNFTFDMSQVSANLRKALMKHPGMAKKAMEEVALHIEGETKDRTPIDEGTLTADVIAETQNYSKGVAAVIKIPINAPSAGYAVAMHEGEYQPGAASMSKQGKTGKQVGRKYITGAIDENNGEILDIIKYNLKVENYG